MAQRALPGTREYMGRARGVGRASDAPNSGLGSLPRRPGAFPQLSSTVLGQWCRSPRGYLEPLLPGTVEVALLTRGKDARRPAPPSVVFGVRGRCVLGALGALARDGVRGKMPEFPAGASPGWVLGRTPQWVTRTQSQPSWSFRSSGREKDEAQSLLEGKTS